MLTFISLMHVAIILFQEGRGGRRLPARHLRWSVLPALAGWFALPLPSLLALAVMLLGFWIHFLRDRQLSGLAILPEWYLPMRFGLTAIASLCLLLGGLAMLSGGVSLGNPFPGNPSA